MEQKGSGMENFIAIAVFGFDLVKTEENNGVVSNNQKRNKWINVDWVFCNQNNI